MNESGMAEAQPEDRVRPRRRTFPLLLAVAAIVFVVLVVVGAYYFDLVTESDAFCGLLCHPIRPQYVTHVASPHVAVPCGACHIGPGLVPKVAAKIQGLGELFSLVTGRYQRPIVAPPERLREAREICTQCHTARVGANPLRRISRYADDQAVGESDTYLLLRVAAEGSASGIPWIHWHVANPVSFASPGPERQDIPWVSAAISGAVPIEFQVAGPSPAQLAAMPHRQMSCLDCHNRTGHPFPNPLSAVDDALAAGRMDPTLPYVKREAARLLSASYPTAQAAAQALAGLADFYRSQYPEIYAGKGQAISATVAALQSIYGRSTFPNMNVAWNSYADNIGHRDSPGCFRCHDGRHVSAAGETIPLRCNLCHSLPVVTTLSQTLDPAALAGRAAPVGSEPQSHLSPTFMRDHRILADDSCTHCHGEIAYGTDNSSFCANSACHATRWPNVDFVAEFPHPFPLEGRHAVVPCSECHKGVTPPSPDDCAACHRPRSEPHFGTDCARCHTVAGWAESVSALVAGSPAIPHRLDPNLQCSLCHGPTGVRPMPASHQGYPAGSCLGCHKLLPAANVPTIPHTIEGRSDCLTCHAEGSRVPEPADHRGRIVRSCLLCHQQLPAGNGPAVSHYVVGLDACLACHGPGKVRPVPASHARVAPDSCQQCHLAPQAGAAPLVPHVLQGREDCLSCHGPGKSVPMPAVTHRWTASDQCLKCHHGLSAQAPQVPHYVQGLADCLACHALGRVRPFPASHQTFPGNSCQECHRALPAAQAPAIAHYTQGLPDCLSCHGPGQVRPALATHVWNTSDLCIECHQSPTPAQALQIPHFVQGVTDCLACHGPGKAVPVVATHQWTDSGPCLGCHQAAPIGQAPQVPHFTRGIGDCLSCHGPGKARPFSATHVGVTSATCLNCHQAGQVGPGPAIPHYVVSQVGCLTCHGPGQVRPVPATHVGIAEGTCTQCHSAPNVGGAPNIPHRIEGAGECWSCHGGQPASHRGIPGYDLCTRCHTLAPIGAPAMEHGVRADCLRCHLQGGGEAGRIPGSHNGWTNPSCVLCHNPGGD